MNEKQKTILQNEYNNILNTLNDISIDFINDRKLNDIKYLCDAFSEYADQNISVYSSDQKEFYNNNVEICENALQDQYINLNDYLKNNSISDLMSRAGVAGWFDKNYSELSQDENDIKTALLIKYLIENDFYISPENFYLYIDYEPSRIADEINSLIEGYKDILNDFENLNKIKCFEFENGTLYITIQNQSFICGGLSNFGIIPEIEKEIDPEEDLETNLQNLFDYIIENSNYIMKE